MQLVKRKRRAASVRSITRAVWSSLTARHRRSLSTASMDEHEQDFLGGGAPLECDPAASEAERQAAYLNGRRMLLPGANTGVARLTQRGIELLWRAYELGHEAAGWDLACCVPSSTEQREQGKSDEAEASSDVIVIDWNLAVPLYEKHAQAGHPIAQKNLGTCYFRGWGVTQSIAKAMELYRQASLQGYDVAQYNLGVCFRQGDGVETDLDQMLELYQKSADQRLHAAQCALAKSYLYGRGASPDIPKAVKLMRAAAEGYPTAMVIMARWYEIGCFHLELNIPLAMHYAIKAAYEKEVDGWDIILRLLAQHYEEDKHGPMYIAQTLTALCCDYIYKHEIVDKCLLRRNLIQSREKSDALTADAIERHSQHILREERRRRQRLMSVLPVEMKQKLSNDRTLCLSPQCSREYYGAGRVVRRFVLREGLDIGENPSPVSDDLPLPQASASPTVGHSDVVLAFCSLACAQSFMKVADEQALS